MSDGFTVHSLRVQQTVQGFFDRLLQVSQRRGRIDSQDSDRLSHRLRMMINGLTPEEGDSVWSAAMLQQKKAPQ